MTAVPILLYHSVADTASAEYRQWCVRPDDFDAHLDVIRQLGFTPLTISALIDARADGTLPERPISITFDDGRADFAEFAAPVLERHGVPATMYVVSGVVGATSSWLPMESERDQPMMTWSDLSSLAAIDVEVGAHSASHAELDVIPKHQLDAEVRQCRTVLSDKLQQPIRSFAYPHGYHSNSVVRAVQAAGFDSACAVHDRWSDDTENPFALSRMFIWDTTSADDLRTILEDPTPLPAVEPKRAVLRMGWRCTRWVRHRSREMAG